MHITPFSGALILIVCLEPGQNPDEKHEDFVFFPKFPFQLQVTSCLVHQFSIAAVHRMCTWHLPVRAAAK